MRAGAARAIFLTVTAALHLVALTSIGSPVQADGVPQPRAVHAENQRAAMLWRETWGGGEVLANSWSLYTGATVALTGEITSTGWRLRTNGGYGQYSYSKWMRGLDGPE